MKDSEILRLYNKNAIAVIHLSKIFMRMDVGDKVPTFEELSKEIGVACGTVQNSIKVLLNEEAIKLQSRGHLGTFLIKKNTKKLVVFADIRFLVGAMSLPYSRVYEGLATGIIATMKNKYDIPVNMTYMREATERIKMLNKGVFDFVILSKGSAINAIVNGSPIKIVIDFGEKTYLSAHVLAFGNDKNNEVKDGMRVGVATNSKSQSGWTKMVCGNKNVTYIEMEYDEIIPALKNGNIDVTVWNKDEIANSLIQFSTVPVDSGIEDNSAVLIVNKDRTELIKLFPEIVNIDIVKRVQKEVISGERQPQY